MCGMQKGAEMKKILSLVLTLCLLTALTGCSIGSAGSDKLQVVCTIFPQYDFVRAVAGDLVENTLLLPIGSESHSYDPTPADILRIADADLFLYIGDSMETWAKGVMSEIDEEKTQVLNLTEALGLQVSAHAEHDGGMDPHIWTSPVVAMDIVALIRDTLMELDPDNAKSYADNAGITLSQYKQLDASIRETVNSAENKQIVFGSRFALHNFAVQYGLTCTAAFDSCTEESEPTASAVASIIDLVRKNNIPVVFYEELTVPTTANTIAAETGAVTRLFHSCHNLTTEEFDGGETYLSLMKQNLVYLMEALNV